MNKRLDKLIHSEIGRAQYEMGATWIAAAQPIFQLMTKEELEILAGFYEGEDYEERHKELMERFNFDKFKPDSPYDNLTEEQLDELIAKYERINKG